MAHPKLLILYNKLFHYRIPIFELLSREYDLTVAYCYGHQDNFSLPFKTCKLTPTKVWIFTLQKENIFRYCQNFDAIIVYGEIAWLKYAALPWWPGRKYKVIFWSIGVSASYNKHFDSNKKLDGLRNMIKRKADALVFYSEYPVMKYINAGFKPDSLFVAPNTVQVCDIIPQQCRDRFLFVGTLYKEKGIMHLLQAYKNAFKANPDIFKLDIIGDGPDFNLVKDWIESSCLSDNIILHGAIYKNEIKAEFFKKSIACISPQQAGLSVLESMGYGVTFITMKDAITGGEIFNIEHMQTGILMSDISELKDILIDVKQYPKKYVQIGHNAYLYYHQYRKPSDMAAGLSRAVRYVLNKKQ